MKPFSQLLVFLLCLIMGISACSTTEQPEADESENTVFSEAEYDGIGPPDDTAVLNPWANASKSGSNNAVYLDIENQGAAAVNLVAVRADIAETVEIRELIQKDGKTKDTSVNELEVCCGDTMSFKPGGNYLLLKGLKRDLNPGETFTLRLFFADGKILVDVPVK